MNKCAAWGTALVSIVAAFLAAGAGQQSPATRVENGPTYTKGGKLIRPDDYATWVFVGAELGIQYGPEIYAHPKEQAPRPGADVGDFHNIYINPEAYAHYVRTGEFPNRTVLVLDAYKAAHKEPRRIVRQGHYEAEHLRIEVAVKDRARPDGSPTVWAYYSFPKGGDRPETFATAASPHRDGECYQCHLHHADVDNVWVQFYPILRRVRQVGR
jgi:Cytochrome P460